MASVSEIFRVQAELNRAITVGFNAWIDYCVWVLEQDGLEVVPFSAHLRQAGRLQAMGLTPLMWQGWLQRVVREQHPILAWEGEDWGQEECVNAQMRSFEGMAIEYAERVDEPVEQIDWAENRSGFAAQYGAYRQLRAQVVAELDSDPGTQEFDADRLIALCPGTTALKSHLSTLWETYEAEIEPARFAPLPMRGGQAQIKGSLSAELQSLHSLNLYLIGYPQTVEVLIGSSLIVTSARLDPRSAEFGESVRSIMPRLEALNAQSDCC